MMTGETKNRGEWTVEPLGSEPLKPDPLGLDYDGSITNPLGDPLGMDSGGLMHNPLDDGIPDDFGIGFGEELPGTDISGQDYELMASGQPGRGMEEGLDACPGGIDCAGMDAMAQGTEGGTGIDYPDSPGFGGGMDMENAPDFADSPSGLEGGAHGSPFMEHGFPGPTGPGGGHDGAQVQRKEEMPRDVRAGETGRKNGTSYDEPTGTPGEARGHTGGSPSGKTHEGRERSRPGAARGTPPNPPEWRGQRDSGSARGGKRRVGRPVVRMPGRTGITGAGRRRLMRSATRGMPWKHRGTSGSRFRCPLLMRQVDVLGCIKQLCVYRDLEGWLEDPKENRLCLHPGNQ